MSQSSLVSLAILKVNLDRGNLEYLDYLRPFVLEAIRASATNVVTDTQVREYLKDMFGLLIPSRAVLLTLKRLARSGILKRAHGQYKVVGPLPDTGFAATKAKAERHIGSVITELIRFSERTIAPFSSRDTALDALLAFLNEFSIDCLRVYLQGTALPAVQTDDKSLVVVSRFVRELAENSPERFDSFMVVVQGHMLANALLCPDLATLPKTFRGLIVFLDTPIVIRVLGLEGEARQMSSNETLQLIRKLGATTAIFSHTRDEVEGVIRGAAEHIQRADGRGAVVTEARKAKRSKSDFVLKAEKLDDSLVQQRIEVRRTPRYSTELQIGEEEFEDALNDEVRYFNPRAREFDINSVRSIYVLRKGTVPRSLEKARAVLMTSNSAFAHAAWKYGARFESSRSVSAVVTDFSVANIAWLKAPMGAPELPAKEILAYCYAALQPSEGLLNALLKEADRLEGEGEISARDHMLLRVSVHTHDVLMDYTLGETAELSSSRVSDIVGELTSEIQREERERREEEEKRHAETRATLGGYSTREGAIKKRWFWLARRVGWVVAVLCDALLLSAIASSYFIGLLLPASSARWLQWLPLIIIAVIVSFGLVAINLICRVSIPDIHEWIRDRIGKALYRGAIRMIYGPGDSAGGPS